MFLLGALDPAAVQEVVQEHIRNDTKTNLKFFEVGPFKIFFYLRNNQDSIYALTDLCNVATANISSCFAMSDFLHKKVMASAGDVVFDLGANIGTESLMLSKIVGDKGKVFAFEPVTFDILRHNIEINNIKNVEIVPAAVSNVPGHTEIEIRDRLLGSTIVRGSGRKQQSSLVRVVPVTTIDDFCAYHKIQRVDFVKMNVEGAEEAVLLGAMKTVKQSYPKWSIASDHVDSRGEQQHPALIRLLQAHNYTIFERPNAYIWAYR
jgi:FkbM family methyltransferase